tara:strand:+ start:1285 stop:1581 length:297 start_codon:yes stop_codon:yes gene_type:complete
MKYIDKQQPIYPGKEIFSTMRKHSVTMRQFKTRTGITLKRQREVRNNGLSYGAARDWIQAITGTDPGEMHHPIVCPCEECKIPSHLTTSTALTRSRTR